MADTFRTPFSRSDLESVMAVIFESVFSPESSHDKEMMDVFLNAATLSKANHDGSEKGMSYEDFRSWCSLVPSVRKFLGSLLMPPDPGRPGFLVPHLLYPDNVDPVMLLLKKEYAWHIGGALPQHEMEEWRLLYHSALHGLSFNTFFGNISNRNDVMTTVLIIKDQDGYVYGGYASQPWERLSDFYGDMKSFLFQLYPAASIFRPTGANTNIQWCAVNFTSESIPNGIGFGGRANHFGLFISASFDQGQTFSCTTFGSPCLSKTSKIQPEVIECWGIVNSGKAQEKQHNAVKGTVLERFKEDRNMLKMVGIAGNSNE
ncbi:PREDICTED: TLD domain-containing protein 1 isoform X2 [Tarenaya hassleriana]|uniref:TLD domain-containing protein 1 isoform X2 n=1 Tax=Tarenaya hassleriana TaxID=28532 RepID=UPI0008FD1BB6|nr:PREDICTED: TLD domain-containing protein 1 isoform X2 [Tarenaya hassleriana]